MTDELETISKVADAATEVAKTGAKAIDAASDTGRFFNAVFGDLVTDGFGLLSDRLKFYRAERWILLGEKTRERLAAEGVTSYRPVPPKIALPLIENATIEDDDDLHSLWADLLTAAMNPDVSDIEPQFITAIKGMMPEDRKTLDYLWSHRNVSIQRMFSGKVNRIEYSPEVILPYDFSEVYRKDNGIPPTSIARLFTLGFFEHKTMSISIPVMMEASRVASADEMYRGSNELEVEDLATFKFTDFGIKFCKAVMPNPTPNE